MSELSQVKYQVRADRCSGLLVTQSLHCDWLLSGPIETLFLSVLLYYRRNLLTGRPVSKVESAVAKCHTIPQNVHWDDFFALLHTFISWWSNNKHLFCHESPFDTTFQIFPQNIKKWSVPFVSFQGISTCPPTPNKQSHQTAFFRVLSPPELQSFHWPAHTRTQLYCEPATPVIQRLLLMARQRLLSPENAAARRTISPERTEEFGHT